MTVDQGLYQTIAFVDMDFFTLWKSFDFFMLMNTELVVKYNIKATGDNSGLEELKVEIEQSIKKFEEKREKAKGEIQIKIIDDTLKNLRA